jgi:Putative prokaryotic signal transducing protein
MPGKMVTIARFADEVEASLARNRLELAGVPAILNNAEAAALGWQLTGRGTIELLVSESDLEAAEEALRYGNLSLEQAWERTAEHHPNGIVEPDAAFLHRTGIITPDTVEEEDNTPPDPFLERIDRAFKAALSGVFFFPLEFYAAFLLYSIFTDDRPIPPSRQLKVWSTLLICVLVLLVILLIVQSLFPYVD